MDYLKMAHSIIDFVSWTNDFTINLNPFERELIQEAVTNENGRHPSDLDNSHRVDNWDCWEVFAA